MPYVGAVLMLGEWVDFHWEVNGKEFEFSIPGGGFVSFTDMMEVLGVADGTNSEGDKDENGTDIAEKASENNANERGQETGIGSQAESGEKESAPLTQDDVDVSDETREFVSDVASVEFSSPELVDVSKVETDTTVGKIKKNRELDVQYSEELTEEQIEEINSKTVEPGDWALISMLPFTSEETLTVTMNDGEVFTIRVTDAQIQTMFLSDNGELYEVTVTYGDDAKIPDGAVLKVTEFEEGSEEYLSARKAVIADKMSRHEGLDLSTLGLAALDLSIVLADEEGNITEEIEPAAPVQVEMKVKALPGVEDLSKVADTLEIQHHVNAQEGVIVENVFDGGTEASFEMKTDQAVIAFNRDSVVDPETVSDKEARWYEESRIELKEALDPDKEVRLEDLGIDISFETPSFSTFTVTWQGRNAQDSEVGYLYATAAGVNTYQFDDSGIYAGQYSLDTNNLHFMNPGGTAAVPDGVIRSENGTAAGDLYLVYNHTGFWSDGNVSESDSVFHIYFTNDGNTYADVTVHYVDSNGNNIRRTNSSNVTYDGGSVDTRYVNVPNGQNYVSGYAGYKNNYQFSRAVFKSTGIAGGSATIRYVDEEGNELNVSNSIAPSTDNADITYLIYDIDGYEYDYCYRNSKEYMMDPILYRQGSVYTLSKDQPGIGHYLQPGDVINVVYKKKNTPTKGGAPLVDTTSQQADPPSILKKSVENGDGTNTLSLSITGSQAPAKLVKLADIIVIFDRSGSMNYNMAGSLVQGYGTAYSNWNNNSRIKQAYDALDGFAENMLSKQNSKGEPLVRMSLVSFSDTAKVESGFTSDKDELMSAVQNLVAEGGTNWEHALQLANNEFRLAADENNVGAMELDPNRATFVVFVTDGQPTFRLTRDNVKNNQFFENDESKRDISTGSYLTYHVFGHGNADHYDRDYSAALKEAKSIVKKEKILYSIGISGDESELDNLGQLISEAGAGENHSVVVSTQDKLIEAFDDIAEKITGYTGQADIKMLDGITGLTNTISKVNQTDDNRLLGVDGDFTYWKSSAPEDWGTWTSEQKDAYTQGMDYANSSSTPEGYENWPSGQKTAFQAGKNAAFTEWTSREADGCAEAVYNTENGAVEWDMGETFMLEDGVTYKVSFSCWPSQEAYDILAKLNNGTITFGDTSLYTNDVWNQFEGDAESGYRLKTNAEGANTTYSKAAIVDGTVTVDDERNRLEFQHVPPMPLTKEDISVAKAWQASRIDTQDPESVVMQVVGDNELYKQFEITPTEQRDGSTTNNWGRSDAIYISCGHLKVDKTTGSVVVYESGHDFTLREVEENSRHWDLDASTCHPMKINNQATMLVLIEGGDIPAAMVSDTNLVYYKSGSDEYYRIDGKVYKDTGAWADITGMNTRRSFLDMAKEILVDGEVTTETADTKFTYKIKINVDPTTLSWDPNLEKYIIISIRGDDYTPAEAIADEVYPTTAKLPTQSGMDSSLIHEGYDDRYLVAESGVEFYLSIKNGWSVRFLNLPAGTTYSIEEIIAEDSSYSFNNARLETRKNTTSADPDSTQTFTQKKLEGSISETSTLYKVIYQNEAKEQDVKIIKTAQDASTLLAGAKFDLYTESAYTSNPKGTPFKKDLISSDRSTDKGQIDLGSLSVGRYYLVETKAPDGYLIRTDPVIITVTGTAVTYDDGTSLSISGNGISQIEGSYQLKVTNDAGYELPATGGPGTRPFTIFGTALIAGAGILLWMSRKNSLF